MFQAEDPLIQYLFNECVSLLCIVMMQFLKKEAVADLTADQLAKPDVELPENVVIF